MYTQNPTQRCTAQLATSCLPLPLPFPLPQVLKHQAEADKGEAMLILKSVRQGASRGPQSVQQLSYFENSIVLSMSDIADHISTNKNYT